MNPNTPRHTQRGQALVESLVAMLLLLPVWWFIAHWQEGLGQRVALVQQARHGALRAVLEAQAPSPVPIRAGLTQSVDAAPGSTGALLRSSRALIEPVLAISPGDARLDTRGWLRLTVTGEPPPGPFWRAHPGTWRESVTTFADDWSLARSRQVAARTQALLPTTPLEWAIASLEPLRSAITLLEPAYRSTCSRRVDPDVLPRDRIVADPAGVAGQVSADGWRPRC